MKVELVLAQRRHSCQRPSKRGACSSDGEKSLVMGRPASAGNRLLAALPSADLALLAPHIQKVSLEQDAVVDTGGRSTRPCLLSP